MVAGTLYTYPGNFRGFKATIAAAYSGVAVKTVELTKESKNTHVPSYESDDKKYSLFDANAIAYYIASEEMRGKSAEDRALVLQWLSYGGETVVPAVAAWVYPSLSLYETCGPAMVKAKNDLRQVFACVNDYLKSRTFLAGERMTLADVSLACDLLLAYRHVAEESFRKPFGNLNRWFLTVMNQEHVKKVCGDLKLCTVAQEFCADKFAKQSAAAAPAKKVKEVKAPKEAAKPKEKKPKSGAEEEEEDFAAEPKQNDPFAAMPKGTFNMDEFKRTYSNEDTLKVALPYFWKNFEENTEFYSIWYCEYNYPEDLSKVFMTSNLIGGMFQRIEKLRKNSFCNMGVYGVDGKNTIAGVWFWKGQNLVFPLCSDWTTDYESYTWKKLDAKNAADRKLLDECWQWEGEVKGGKFNTGKTFK
jgi:elongation factor 1-gamma